MILPDVRSAQKQTKSWVPINIHIKNVTEPYGNPLWLKIAVRCQASSLLGRLETLGPGGAAAAGRRQQAGELERRWRRESEAHQLATIHSWRALRTGFAMLS